MEVVYTIYTPSYNILPPFLVTGFQAFQLVKASQAILHWPATKCATACFFIYITLQPEIDCGITLFLTSCNSKVGAFLS